MISNLFDFCTLAHSTVVPITITLLVFQSVIGDHKLFEVWTECVTGKEVGSGVESPANPMMVIFGRA